ncbi:MAG: ferrous iron transport protein A [Eubacteriaceae bacterium]|jgi:ferrous iron transport protein A|nr:ferrous iron transport protein A [Eubacteriaceae bacterium]
MKYLNEVPIGSTVKVQKIEGMGPVKRRMMDMGLTKGTEVTILKVAPLGDPLEIIVRGYALSIRKAEAKCVVVS